jgi:hypothetical protein
MGRKRHLLVDTLGLLLAVVVTAASVSENAVIAPPGSTARVRGRAAYIQSYRDYDQAATTLAFTPEEPEIDIIGDVAVAQCPFVVVYELEGERHQAVGRDVLVLARIADAWQVVWRTMHTESTEPAPTNHEHC